MSEVDRMLIANISDKILGHPKSFNYLSDKVETNQKQSSRFERSPSRLQNTDLALKVSNITNRQEENLLGTNVKNDEMISPFEVDSEEDIECRNITTSVGLSRIPNKPSVKPAPIIEEINQNISED